MAYWGLHVEVWVWDEPWKPIRDGNLDSLLARGHVVRAVMDDICGPMMASNTSRSQKKCSQVVTTVPLQPKVVTQTQMAMIGLTAHP